MIQEAIKFLQEAAVSGSTAKILNVPEPAGTYMIQEPGKSPEIRHAEAAPRHYSAFSLAGLCRQIDHFAAEDGKPSILVFVGRGKITALLDETQTRRNWISMTLPASKPFAFVCGLASGSGDRWTQKEIVWNLRTEIGSENVGPDNILTRLRSLKFSSSAAGDSDIKSGRESMGKQVTAAVTSGGEDLPDSCVLSVPVYADMVLTKEPRLEAVECAIDIDPAGATFLLKPLPGEIERAQREVDEAIAEFVRQNSRAAQVFNGSV